MADLVRDYVSLGKLAGLAAASLKPLLQLLEERGVQIDPPIERAVERAHGRLRRAALRPRNLRKDDQLRLLIASAGLLEDDFPAVFGIAQHRRDELAQLVGGSAGRRA